MTDYALTPAGAIRDHITALFPTLPVYRGNAPEEAGTPVAVITDGVAMLTQSAGTDILINEEIQVDLYTGTDNYTLPDQLHQALHQAVIYLEGSQVHRVNVTGRATQYAPDDDPDVTRTIFSVSVRRRLSSANDPNNPLPPREPWPSEIDAQKGQPNGLASLDSTGHLEEDQRPRIRVWQVETVTEMRDLRINDQVKWGDVVWVTEGYSGRRETWQFLRIPEYEPTYTGLFVKSVDWLTLLLEKGIADGLASLDENGVVPLNQLPPLDYDPAGSAAQALADANAYTDTAVANINLPENLETTDGAQAKADAALAAAEDYADNAITSHVGATDPHGDRAYADAAFIAVSEKGAHNGVATLNNDGKVPNAQLPPLAITETHAVASEAAMLALDAQVGDVAVRSDLSKSFILATAPASTLTNWQELLTPPNAVLSVEGRTGVVSLSDLFDASGAADEALTAAESYADAAEASAVAAAESYTDTAVAAHLAATDPHGDRAYADTVAQEAKIQSEQYIKNATGTTLSKGQAVYINGATGDNPTVALADADAEATSSKTIGILAQNLANGDHGYVITEGLLEGINTSAATAGDPIWLSGTPGGLLFGLANKPSAPTHLVFLGFVLRAHATNGKIYVKVQNGFELDELHNVQISTPTNGQTLTYNTTTGLWGNHTLTASEVGADATGTASTAVAAHVAATDPHGDRAYADSTFQPKITRQTVTVTTASLANGAIGNVAATIAKSYRLLSITTSAAARVRVYTTTAARTSDASRLEGYDPTWNAGVVLDVVTTAATLSGSLSPSVAGSNMEASPTSSIALAVTNKSGSTAAITVTLTYIAQEA